jgi:dihydroxyacetone kinase phosphoprotein-dependent L subunit
MGGDERMGIDAKSVMNDIIGAIEENKGWLSEIDGAIGDGDHGVNMAKGFGMVRKGIDSVSNTLPEMLRYAGMTLMSNIGGAMGPIYGTFFLKMAKPLEGKESLEPGDVTAMLTDALEGVKKRGGAVEGDKTLVDTLSSALSGYQQALSGGADLEEALSAMIASAKEGMEKTKELVAKKGRSSRLGERSRGTIDAGAASCYLILEALGEGLKESL